MASISNTEIPDEEMEEGEIEDSADENEELLKKDQVI